MHPASPRAPRRTLAAAAAAAFAALVGCTTLRPPGCAAGEEAAIDDTLYFGLARAGGAVSAAEWSAFLRDVVTPRFPAGLSSWPAAGQWRAADGTIVREDSVVVEIVHGDDAASDAAIRALVDDYKRRFAQEAVLRVKRRVCSAL